MNGDLHTAADGGSGLYRVARARLRLRSAHVWNGKVDDA